VPVGNDLARSLFSSVYPALVDVGYDVPLNLVADMAALYRGAAGGAPPSCWLSKDFAERYFRGLQEEASDGILWQLLHTSARGRRRRSTGDQELLAFLIEAAQALYLAHPNARFPRLPAQIRAELRKRETGFSLQGDDNDPDAQAFVRLFLKMLSAWGTLRDTTRRMTLRSSSVPLLIAAETVPLGRDALDWRLLQACRRYQPKDALDQSAALWRRVRRLLGARETRIKRERDFGIGTATTQLLRGVE